MGFDKDWERFNGGQNEPVKDRIHVTINKGRNFQLNTRVYDLMGKPEAVYLYFNRQQDSIAIEPTSARMPQAFHVKEHGRSGWRINATPFMRHFGIKFDRTYKFTRPDFQGQSLVLKLSDITAIGGFTRKRKASAVKG